MKDRIKDIVTRVKRFILTDIWAIELHSMSLCKRLGIKALRSVMLAYRGFEEDKVNLRASALTFYSVLSVVPVLAMIFGISKGFGFEEKMQTLLYENLKGQEDVANWLISFSENMLDSVKGGWIFGIGLVFLLWTVLQVLGNIENAFNSIWQVKRSRVFFRKFSDYFSIMLIAPVLIILSSSAQVVIMNMVDHITREVTIINYMGPVLFFFVKLIPYILVWLLFTFIYMVMPNTKVQFSSALFAGIIAGTIFQLVQWGYIHFQVGVSKYNTIYGSFAALPLFLVWLNWSWLIVLFGAEISFSAQNHHLYEYESDIKNLNHRSYKLISLLISHTIIKIFQKGETPLTAQELSAKLKLPVRLVRHILYELVECRIMAETPSSVSKDPAFLPARDISSLTLYSVISSLNAKGIDYTFGNAEQESLSKLTSLLKKIDSELAKGEFNIPLKDI